MSHLTQSEYVAKKAEIASRWKLEKDQAFKAYEEEIMPFLIRYRATLSAIDSRYKLEYIRLNTLPIDLENEEDTSNS